MPAPLADVLIVICAPANRDVMMPAEKTGKSMSNPWRRLTRIKYCRPTALTECFGIFCDSGVVNFMPQQRTSHRSRNQRQTVWRTQWRSAIEWNWRCRIHA